MQSDDDGDEDAGLAARAGRCRARVHAATSCAVRGTAACMIALLRGLGARDVGGEPALRHHQHAVAERQQLGQLGGDQQDGAAGGGELADDGRRTRP